jgi:ribonucleoside-diphosphate reductase beta chain
MSKLLQRSESYKPFHYPWAVERSVEHEKAHWGEWEASLQDDVSQWKDGTITPHERSHITQILRLFTQSDVEVASNYLNVFIPLFKNNEVRAMLTSFSAREFIHQRSYALLNDTLGLDEAEYSAFLEYEDMKNKIEFMRMQDCKTTESLAISLAQTVCNEGMSLFSAFVMLLNYQRFGKMKGMCEIVEWSIRDETMHVEGMVQLFLTFVKEHPELDRRSLYATIRELYREAVELEDKVVEQAYGYGEPQGLKLEEVKAYIRYLANRRLQQLGMPPLYEDQTKNPIMWLDWIVSGDSFKNFFEGRVTDYSADGMDGEWGWEEIVSK